MTTTPVDPSDLADFPGHPFSAGVVDAAVATVRRMARWHIAPTATETVEVDSDGGRVLVLPSLKVASVTAVRDVTGDDPVTLDEWRLRRSSCTLWRACGWPCGTLEVELTHGFEDFPSDLLPVLAQMCLSESADRRIKSQASGPFSITYESGLSVVDPALAYYTLPSRP